MGAERPKPEEGLNPKAWDGDSLGHPSAIPGYFNDPKNCAARLRWIGQILERIAYKGWRFLLMPQAPFGYLQLVWSAPDSATGELEVQRSRKWLLSPHMTRSEIVQTAFLAVKVAEEHELRETFRFDGQTIFGPHFDVEVLAEIAESKDVR